MLLPMVPAFTVFQTKVLHVRFNILLQAFRHNCGHIINHFIGHPWINAHPKSIVHNEVCNFKISYHTIRIGSPD